MKKQAETQKCSCRAWQRGDPTKRVRNQRRCRQGGTVGHAGMVHALGEVGLRLGCWFLLVCCAGHAVCALSWPGVVAHTSGGHTQTVLAAAAVQQAQRLAASSPGQSLSCSRGPHCCSGVVRCRFAPHPRRLIVRGGGCAAAPGAAPLPCKPRCCPPPPCCLRRRPAPGPHSSSPS